MKTAIKYLLVLAMASFAFVGCTTTINGHSKVKQWEYCIVTWNSTDSSTELDKLSSEGWTLVSVVPVDHGPGQNPERQFYLKRPKH